MSHKRKARQVLEQSRKKGAIEGQIKLSQEKIALAKERLSMAAEKYEDSMIVLYRDADTGQRVTLEAEYQRTAKSSLKCAYEARIIAALSKTVARRL